MNQFPPHKANKKYWMFGHWQQFTFLPEILASGEGVLFNQGAWI
jgi:hypothetical protein